jgi:hypothetical protein
MRADTQHDEPLGFLDTVAVGLRVAQGFPFGVFCFFDFVLGAVADEDGFAAPFDDDLCGVSSCWVEGAKVGQGWGGDIRFCPRGWRRGRFLL